MKNTKITLGAIVATILLSGCGGVDKEKLAELTSGKNFNQIEQGYFKAKINKNEENIEIYEYWLKENGAKVKPTFNFELYKIKTDKDIQKQLVKYEKEKAQIKKAFDEEMQSIKKGHKLNYYAIRSINSKIKMLHLMPQDLKIVKEYLVFLKDIEEKLQKAEKQRKEEQQRKFEEQNKKEQEKALEIMRAISQGK